MQAVFTKICGRLLEFHDICCSYHCKSACLSGRLRLLTLIILHLVAPLFSSPKIFPTIHLGSFAKFYIFLC